MLLLLAATAQVDDATLRQRETNPEHQETELRTALRDAVGTDSRDGAWEKFKLEPPAEIRRFLFVEAMRLRVAHAAPEAIEGGERGGERLRSKVSATGESSSIT